MASDLRHRVGIDRALHEPARRLLAALLCCLDRLG
jgi:hypothetical protein